VQLRPTISRRASAFHGHYSPAPLCCTWNPQQKRYKHDPVAAPSAAGNIANKEWAGGSMLRGSLRGGLKTNAIRNGAAPGMFASGAFALTCLAGTAYADGDAANGKAAFVRQCAICHTSEKGGDNRFGPNLFGIVGKKAGTVPGFGYTNAFKNRANWEWTEDAIGGWMMFPSTMIPGTAMGVFQGIAEKDRDDLVAYLVTLK
jgi:cytochrome c